MSYVYIDQVLYFHLAGSEDSGSSCQCQRSAADRRQIELHQSMAITTRVRHIIVHRQIYGP